MGPIVIALISIATIVSSSENSANFQTLNILHVNEEANHVADIALDSAITYLKNLPEFVGQINMKRVVGQSANAEAILESLCGTYGDMVERNEPPHVVIDTTMLGMASEAVKTFIMGLNLPSITTSFAQDGDFRSWKNANEEMKKYFIPVMSPASVIPAIIRPIILAGRLPNAAILYDTTFVLNSKLRKLLLKIRTRLILAPIKPNERIQDQLEGLRNLRIRNFFVFGNLSNIQSVLQSAERMNILNAKFGWFVITQESSDFSYGCKNCKVIYIQPGLNPEGQKILDDIRSTYDLTGKPDIVAAFYFNLALKTFITLREMIIKETWPLNLEYETCESFNGTNSPPRNGLDLLSAMNQTKDLTPIYGPMNITTNGESRMEFDMKISGIIVSNGVVKRLELLGSWSFKNGLELINKSSLVPYIGDVVYKVATVIHEPFIIVDESAPKNLSGYCIDLLDRIAGDLNFDYEIYVAPGNTFGQLNDDGGWDGIMKELIDKKADIGLGTLSVMAERENVIDFTVPIYDMVGMQILMKKRMLSTSLVSFITVLENEVWICIIAAYFCTSTVLWFYERYSPDSYRNNREKYKDHEDENREFNYKECLWFCLMSLTPQGGGQAPMNLSGRLLAASWWLFGFIIITSYIANLTSFLTTPFLATPIESLADLCKQQEIQYAPLHGSIEAQYFERMKNIEEKFYEIWREMSLNESLSDLEKAQLAVWNYPVDDKYSKIWKTMNQFGYPKSITEALNRIRESTTETLSEGFALIGNANDIKYLEMTNCDLTVIGEEFAKKPVALAVQKGSPLKQKLNEMISLLSIQQLDVKLKQKWWNNNPARMQCDVEDEQSDGVSLKNMGGVFLVVVLGICLATMVLILEFWWFKCRRAPKAVHTKSLSKNQVASNVQLRLRSRRIPQSSNEYFK